MGENETVEGAGADVAPGLATWWAQNELLGQFILTGLALFAGWLVIRLAERSIVRSAQTLGRKRKWDDYQIRAAVGRTKPLRMTIKIAVFVVVTLTLMATWGLQTAFTGLLAGAGFAGIVIGLAAGDIIGDILAGFLLMLRGPFELGDWVEIDGIQGIVDDVTLQDTTLLTFDNEKVTIPNRLVEGNKIRNFTHARRLRIKIPVGVVYGTDVPKAKQILIEVAGADPDIKQDPPPLAVVVGFGDSSVNMELRIWLDPVRNSALILRDRMLVAIHERFRAEGIEIAFPHLQIVQDDAWMVRDG